MTGELRCAPFHCVGLAAVGNSGASDLEELKDLVRVHEEVVREDRQEVNSLLAFERRLGYLAEMTRHRLRLKHSTATADEAYAKDNNSMYSHFCAKIAREETRFCMLAYRVMVVRAKHVMLPAFKMHSSTSVLCSYCVVLAFTIVTHEVQVRVACFTLAAGTS